MAVRDVVQAAAGALGGEALYVDDVFSTYLYTGNGSTQTITNGIDLAGEGGMVWVKCRSVGYNNNLWDTERGATNYLISNLTNAQASSGAGTGVSAFNADGFTLGSGANLWNGNETYASWTFRKAPKFFDVVTYTGNGTDWRSINHALECEAGFIAIKRLDDVGDWWCSSPSLGAYYYWLKLNTTDQSTYSGASTSIGYSYSNSTTFTITSGGAGAPITNVNGATYVAYLFAHNAGGFGDDGLQNVISCGSFTGNGSSGQQITLGYEPQFIILKRTDAADTWRMYDNMRGMGVGGQSATLQPSSSNNESSDGYPYINATGFTTGSITAGTYIYIAIRRPMKTPTAGTEVFALDATSTTDIGGYTLTSNFPVDLYFFKNKNGGASIAVPRITVGDLRFNSTGSESSVTSYFNFANNTGVTRTTYQGNISSVDYALRRAPGFFDVVAYTGAGSSGRQKTHNLSVAPELIFVKARSNVQNWSVLCTLNSGLQGRLNTTDALGSPSAAVWGDGVSYVAPTSTVFTVGTDNETNYSGWTYIAYLFATLAGVSKVGSYTATGSTQNIDCGFSSGARFVLIKRTDSSGNWWLLDTARGIVAGNDPLLELNTTSAEDSSYDNIDPYSAGFTLTAYGGSSPYLNISGATYIFLAIA